MFLSNLLHPPQDSRWHGKEITYSRIFLAKNLFVIVLAILIIPEGIIFRRSWTNEGYSMSEEYSPYNPWLRISIALLPESIFILATILLTAMRRFHPIVALVGGIVLFGLYLTGATINLLVVMSGEVWFDERDLWDSLCYAEVGVQLVLALLHVALAGCAAVAVHRWRKGRQGVGSRSADVELVVSRGEGDVKRSTSF